MKFSFARDWVSIQSLGSYSLVDSFIRIHLLTFCRLIYLLKLIFRSAHLVSVLMFVVLNMECEWTSRFWNSNLEQNEIETSIHFAFKRVQTQFVRILLSNLIGWCTYTVQSTVCIQRIYSGGPWCNTERETAWRYATLNPWHWGLNFLNRKFAFFSRDTLVLTIKNVVL